jgi:UDP-arabinose 4-epimerase
MVAEVTGRTVPVKNRPRREGDPPVLIADTTLAKRMLNFSAKRSDLRTIVRDAHESIKSAYGL